MATQSIMAREAARIAPSYITEITGREPEQMTAIEPTDEGGWVVEVEIVEERRIPSSADTPAVYEIDLDRRRGTARLFKNSALHAHRTPGIGRG